MSDIKKQLLEDANKRIISKDQLLEACLSKLSNDDAYDMAIEYGFILTKDDDDIKIVEDRHLTPQERIIEAVLARHGE